MTLFFETSRQGAEFLLLCVVGFAVALLFDGERCLRGSRFRPLADVVTMLLSGALLLLALLAFRSAAVRAYHWLAMVSGALIYLCGVRRAACALLRRKKTDAKRRTSAGVSTETSK